MDKVLGFANTALLVAVLALIVTVLVSYPFADHLSLQAQIAADFRYAGEAVLYSAADFPESVGKTRTLATASQRAGVSCTPLTLRCGFWRDGVYSSAVRSFSSLPDRLASRYPSGVVTCTSLGTPIIRCGY